MKNHETTPKYVGYHSFETRPGGQPSLMTGSRVRWVDPGQPKKKPSKQKGY